jgi:transglutaminase-like putative cysteine protease
MIRLQLSLDLDYLVASPGCDFIFNIHAAHTPQQRVVDERLVINQNLAYTVDTDAATRNRYLRLSAQPGLLRVSYAATVDLLHHRADPAQVAEVPVAQLPARVLSYLYPSRYCQSDLLGRLALREFGLRWQGYGRVQGICDWVQQHTAYAHNTSDSNTSALDTLQGAVGVCRDFAHLMIALCRACNIPARFATGINYGTDPALAGPDFHAYVEAFVGDRWYLFDPSGIAVPMGLVRFGTGRDAADVAFATIFGPVTPNPPRLQIQAVAGDDGRFYLPQHCAEALSTDA